MLRTAARHGCLFLGTVVSGLSAFGSPEPIPVHAETFDIDYHVNDAALPLASVQLWYTPDRGQTWRDYGGDPDRQSPITFSAPGEGLYGFYLIVTNAAGPSSSAPLNGAQPQLWAFVDSTAPVVQLHPLRQSTQLGKRILQVRWTAIDAHLGPRPVALSYESRPAQRWRAITPDPIANTGRYDWTIPDDVSGPVAVRVTVQDQGGHRTHSKPEVMELGGHLSPAGAAPDDVRLSIQDPAVPVSRPAAARAKRLFDEALRFRDRGLYAEGIARLREVVRLRPDWPEAFAEMADMLYRIGDPERALSAYQLALRHRPNMRSALRGSALVYRRQNDHTAAARSLRTILHNQPDDAETWMNLGDVAVYQGDELLARECYTRATQVDPRAPEIVAEARKRLDVMASVSRTYRPTGE